MHHQPPFISPDVADRLVREDDAEARNRGALVVALQLDHSSAFVLVAVVCIAVGAIAAWWLSSWVPALVAGAVAAFMYYRLFVSTARDVARAGILPELQAAYKRLYYSDAEFKVQVDQLRASQK